MCMYATYVVFHIQVGYYFVCGMYMIDAPMTAL